MRSTTTTTTDTPLAVRPRAAAKMLGISERTLWGLSAPRGPIPCVRRGGKGGAVLYRVADLDAWLAGSVVTHSGDVR